MKVTNCMIWQLAMKGTGWIQSNKDFAEHRTCWPSSWLQMCNHAYLLLQDDALQDCKAGWWHLLMGWVTWMISTCPPYRQIAKRWTYHDTCKIINSIHCHMKHTRMWPWANTLPCQAIIITLLVSCHRASSSILPLVRWIRGVAWFYAILKEEEAIEFVSTTRQ